MKKTFLIIFLCFFTFMGKAQNTSIKEQVETGNKTSISQTENREWKEAFATCRQMDALINAHERDTKKNAYNLHYLVSKERLRMYKRLMNTEKCKFQLDQMENYVDLDKSAELKADYLLSKADFYRHFGQTSKSLDCYKEYIRLKASDNNEVSIRSCYEELIQQAKKNNNSSLSFSLNALYNQWQDSIQTVKNQIEIKELQAKSASDQQVLEEKENKINNYWGLILVLCVVSLLLILAVCFCGAVTLRYIRQNKKLNNSLNFAQSNNELMSQFIGNIHTQVSPSLQAIADASSAAGVQKQTEAMQQFFAHIEEFTELERTRDEHYELKELNINTLCENILDQAKASFHPEVEAVLQVPRVNIHTHSEALTRILLYLLESASMHTDSGKITLEFKKRSAHSGQFIVSDTGSGIPEEKRDSLFKPFTNIRNLAEGDGLGLPTCNLIAYKLNGTLRLDETYKKGTRFILELHS